MKQSLTFYLTILIIKLKGLKKNFSQDPINYKKIRKEDIHKPKGSFFKNNKGFKVSDTIISEIKSDKNTGQLIIFIHGGAFISGPSQIHWDTAKTISKETNHTIWMCDYPKAPENKISKISANIDAVYQKALEKYESKRISIIGDSVGGTLTTGLIQRLVINQINLPSKIILISPVMDSSLTNPDIDKIDPIDPMLSKVGVLSAKKMCAENNDLKNPMISPLLGSFNNFPPTFLFMAEHDITCPDQKLALEKLIASKINIQVFHGENMPHIWPLLPVMKEAQLALNEVINIFKTTFQ